ncbi:putative RNA-directed DNA polymerase, eukaryota, reverse transcriptase zinc-binding domain protein, partial [Tanacetum coccineum]
MGARKIIVPNVGPIGCIPYQRDVNPSSGGNCVASSNHLAQNFNSQLKGLLQELTNTLEGSTFVYANINRIVEDIIRNYQSYGFTNADSACCYVTGRHGGIVPCAPPSKVCYDTSKYVFWDPYHTSESANIILANRLLEGGPLSSYEATARINIVRDLTALEHSKILDLRQKTKIRWAMDGDEKSRFFHGMINSNLNRIRINGLNIRGSWTTKPARRPLSPFRFIIAIEALNVSLLQARNNNIFHVTKVGKDNIHISHIQFADHALIMGEWSLRNVMNLSKILTCFHLASGLKVNYNKSKLYGIGVTSIELNSLALTIGCFPSYFPCTYLGLPIGAKMLRCANWNALIDKFQKRLSSWKSKSLSISGRLTLIRSFLGSLGVYYFSTFKSLLEVINKLEGLRRKFFWGGNMDDKKISWIAWNKVIALMSCGGLGIGDLKSSNLAMLCKWWWRFHTEDHALWRQVIQSIHGIDGGLNDISSVKSKTGPWFRIAKLKDDLLKVNVSLPSTFKKKVGDGSRTKFWHDEWLGGLNLKETFPKLFRLETHQSCLLRDRTPSYRPLSSEATSLNQPFHGFPSNSVLVFNWSWIKPIRSKEEFTEFASICNLISHLCLTCIKDKWECTTSDSRILTVKAMDRSNSVLTATKLFEFVISAKLALSRTAKPTSASTSGVVASTRHCRVAYHLGFGEGTLHTPLALIYSHVLGSIHVKLLMLVGILCLKQNNLWSGGLIDIVVWDTLVSHVKRSVSTVTNIVVTNDLGVMAYEVVAWSQKEGTNRDQRGHGFLKAWD